MAGYNIGHAFGIHSKPLFGLKSGFFKNQQSKLSFFISPRGTTYLLASHFNGW
jgi:hypothetical protein